MYRDHPCCSLVSSSIRINMLDCIHLRSYRSASIPCYLLSTRPLLSDLHADGLIRGRHHEPNCPAILGIAMWSDYPELGMMVDMLTSTAEL
ncbi:hypothetical protein AKJ16_DCAP26405 [Drosera capensis]